MLRKNCSHLLIPEEQLNPNIVKFWWNVDRAVKATAKQKKQADDELIIEYREDASPDAICEQMVTAHNFIKKLKIPKIVIKIRMG